MTFVRMGALLVLLGGLLLPVSAARTCESADGLVFPEADWAMAAPASPEAVGAFEAVAFPPGQDEASREGPRTNGLLVVKDGRIVYERYARGFGPDRPHIFWSVSKSVLQAVYGAAVRDGLVDIDRPVAERSPWIGAGDKARITYRELLQMRSGIGFNEAYEFAPLRSSVIGMLYSRGWRDMARFAAAHAMAHPPGAAWSYKSGDSLILAAALRDLVEPERYADYPWTALFDRLGMTSVTWERDGQGTFVGSSYVYATPRDMARLGHLYLADGCWAGERLLPEGWVAFAGTLSPPLATPDGQSGSGRRGPPSYGAHWWLNRPGAGGERPFSAARESLLVASGHWGQKLLVLPEAGLVIVRTADDRRGFSTDKLIEAALVAFGEPGG